MESETHRGEAKGRPISGVVTRATERRRDGESQQGQEQAQGQESRARNRRIVGPDGARPQEDAPAVQEQRLGLGPEAGRLGRSHLGGPQAGELRLQVADPPGRAAHEEAREEEPERARREPAARRAREGRDREHRAQEHRGGVDPPGQAQGQAETEEVHPGRARLRQPTLHREHEPQAERGEGEERRVGPVRGQPLVEKERGTEGEVEAGEEPGPITEGFPRRGPDPDDRQGDEDRHGSAKHHGRGAEDREDQGQVVRLEGSRVMRAVVEDGMGATFEDVLRHDRRHRLVRAEGHAAPLLEDPAGGQGDEDQEGHGATDVHRRPRLIWAAHED